jgi:hypothetical protein
MRLVERRSPLGECEQRGDSRPPRRERRSHHVQDSVCFSNCTFRNAAGLGAAVGDSYVSRREHCLSSESKLGGTDRRFVTPLAYTAPSGENGFGTPVVALSLPGSWKSLGRVPSGIRHGGAFGRLEFGYTRDIHRRATHRMSALYGAAVSIFFTENSTSAGRARIGCRLSPWALWREPRFTMWVG